MSHSDKEVLSENEAFVNAYYYLVRALEVLAADASTQCDRMSNFNVAWEIKDDVMRGASVANMPNNELSPDEKSRINEVIAALNDLPSSLLVATDDRAGNMQAMLHPAWIPIRAAAANLLKLLSPTTERIRAILFNKINVHHQ